MEPLGQVERRGLERVYASKRIENDWIHRQSNAGKTIVATGELSAARALVQGNQNTEERGSIDLKKHVLKEEHIHSWSLAPLKKQTYHLKNDGRKMYNPFQRVPFSVDNLLIFGVVSWKLKMMISKFGMCLSQSG